VNSPEKPRVVAVDWSGAIDGVKKKIWLAESDGSSLVRLECGRTREALVDHLIDMAETNRRFVVGLDFAFSLPQWYLEANGLTSAYQLWSLAQARAEEWLRSCPSPFWGRNGVKNWRVPEEFRSTELDIPSFTGIRPKSVFQVYGAGAVGTGSLRGLPFLKQLHDAGFSIWPFDPPGWPMVVEIYPRLLTGPMVKSRKEGRLMYLRRVSDDMSEEMRTIAASSEDAFDAAVSAVVMAQEVDRLSQLMRTTDPVLRLEGIIWYPGWETGD
jgi:hypothetical protein